MGKGRGRRSSNLGKAEPSKANQPKLNFILANSQEINQVIDELSEKEGNVLIIMLLKYIF